MSEVIAQIGATDCERLRDGLLAQPVNTWTSFGYVGVGIWVGARGLRSVGAAREAQVALGIVLVGVGLGSVAFHGPQTWGARWLHDVPIAIAAVVVITWDLLVAGRIDATTARRTFLIGTVTVGALFAALPDAGPWVGAPLAVGVIWGEILVRRRRAPALVMGGFLALGLLANALGRTDAPLCDPETWAQLHGLWHLITAAVFLTWSVVAFDGRADLVARRTRPGRARRIGGGR